MLFQTPTFTSASFSGSVSGDGSLLTGIVSSSYALTASYAENAGGGAGFPYSGSADITGSLTVTQGTITGATVGNIIPFYFANQGAFPSATTYHGAVAHSHADAAMYYAHGGVWLKLKNDDGIYSGSFEGDGSQLTGIIADVIETSTVVDTFTTAPSHSVSHNFGTKNVIISVYEGDTVFIPNSIVTTDNNTVDIVFGSNITGRVVVAKGGHIVSGSIQQATSSSYASLATTAEGIRAASTGSRPSAPATGSFWFSTEAEKVEVYTGNKWKQLSFLEPSYTVDYLIVGGGGAGGYVYSGGGGAGGYRTTLGPSSGGGSSLEPKLYLTPNETYTITVGGGGSGTSGDGSDGSTSSITGTGISKESSGGGGGASNNGSQAGHDGGSGGGGSESPSPGGPGGSGTSGQGYAGGTGYYGGGAVAVGGGGGGAASVGSNGASTNPGNGGNGLTNPLTGNAYAGGGGAGSNGNGGGTGGTGGGGAGSGTVAGTAGTDNTGGGGGGSLSLAGGSGGSGIVILKMLTDNYSNTLTGAVSSSVSGSYTLLHYTGSGTYTA